MALVAANTPEEWRDLALAEMEQYLRDNPTFHVDEWWDHWDAKNLPQPHNQRAIGPVIKTIASRGFMERSGAYMKSVRSHLSEKPVWNSLIYLQRKEAS